MPSYRFHTDRGLDLFEVCVLDMPVHLTANLGEGFLFNGKLPRGFRNRADQIDNFCWFYKDLFCRKIKQEPFGEPRLFSPE